MVKSLNQFIPVKSSLRNSSILWGLVRTNWLLIQVFRRDALMRLCMGNAGSQRIRLSVLGVILVCLRNSGWDFRWTMTLILRKTGSVGGYSKMCGNTRHQGAKKHNPASAAAHLP